MATKTAGTGLVIEAPRIEIAHFHLEGITPLIVHRWSAKAKRQMLAKQMKAAPAGREPKDPEAEFNDSLYRLPDGGFGFPSVAVKGAMVRAGKLLGVQMVDSRQAFHIDGTLTPDGENLLRIEGEPTPREDPVSVGMGKELRYRGEFMPWSMDVPVRYNARLISTEQLAALLVQAGFGVGIGEWRPEKSGISGCWEVR